MSGVKANWNLADLEVPDSDPMQDITRGKLIDLTRSEAEIIADINESLSAEEYLWRVPKIRCPMKQDDTPITQMPPCASCPEYDPDGPIGRLCKVGIRQVDLLTELEAFRQREDVRRECEELAAACL